MTEFQKIKKRSEKKSCAELAYQSIRDLILNGEIKEGQLISENQLAEYLKMSRTPVREAIRRLEAEQVLESRQGLGTMLRTMTLKDIRDLFEVREHLEMIAAQTALQRISDGDIRDLECALNSILEDCRGGGAVTMERFARADSWIHDLLIERSENEYVKYLMDKIHFHVARYRAISFEVSSNVEESTQQHLDLLECMKRRDQEEFKDKISAHIQWSYKILQNNLNGL